MKEHLHIIGFAIIFQGFIITALAQNPDLNSYDREIILSTPKHIAFADMNKDGIQDMVGVNGTDNANVEIYHGVENGIFELDTILDGSSGLQYNKVFLQDLNADNYPDIIAVSSISGIIFISDMLGNYAEVEMTEIEAEYYKYATTFADFNNDGSIDLFYNSRVHLNNGEGSFSVIDRTFYHSGTVAFDYNMDGNIDLITADSGVGTIKIYNGMGDGSFNMSPDLEFDGSPGLEINEIYIDKMISYDINGDGAQDIIAKDFINNQFIIFFNDKDNLFAQSTVINLNHNFYSVLELGDVDLDGSLDIIGSDDDNTIHYWSILADGIVGERKEYETNTGTIREVHLVNAIGEDFVDLIIVNDLGRTNIYSDKLNAEITQIATSKEYDNAPFLNFYELSTEVQEVTIDYQGFNEAQSDVGSYSVNVLIVDDNYEGNQSLDIEIFKKSLSVTASDVNKTYGEANPALSINYSGFANGEDEMILDSLPKVNAVVNAASNVGIYPITISEIQDNNYDFTFIEGALSINKATLFVSVLDVTIIEGDSLPELEINIENFVNGDNEDSLLQLPIASTSAKENSPPGEYDIVLSGGEAENYLFEYQDGIFTINKVLSISDDLMLNVYPNPASNVLHIKSGHTIRKVQLTNFEGKSRTLELKNGSLDISNIESGFYILNIEYNNSIGVFKLLIK